MKQQKNVKNPTFHINMEHEKDVFEQKIRKEGKSMEEFVGTVVRDED